MLNHLAALSVMFLFSINSFASGKFKYNELEIKNYDQMQIKVHDYVRKAQNLAIKNQEKGDDEAGDQLAIDTLSTALQFILSRPDKDNMVSKLLPEVRKELSNYNAYETSLQLIATDAITAIGIKKLPVAYRATSVFVLENLMSQLRPQIDTNKSFRGIVEKIKNSKIKLSKEIVNNRKLVGMFRSISPSETAEKLLKNTPYKPITTSEE